ncbi:MAG: radical SAM protein [Coriobacteriia bacterium]|nr:radical SAM protein [Coriobacteriia bacterium]
MASVLLIRPLCAGDDPEFAEPLGIERIAGCLHVAGHDVRMFDRRLYREERRAGFADADAPTFFDELHAVYDGGDGPDIVGLSLMTSDDVPDARRIVSRLRSWWPQTTFTVGGVYVTCASDAAGRAFPAGVLVQTGEGEEPMLALARQLDAGCGNLDVTPAMCAAAASTPDEWPLPYRPHLVRYARLHCAVNMQTSRGCPGSCVFCATPGLPEQLRRWQPRNVRLVVDEMQCEAERLAQTGLPAVFNFVDDDFGPLSRLEELADEVEARELHVSFACEMRLASLAGQPDLVSRLARLHAAGLSRVFVGVESLNREALREWHKPVDLGALPAVLAAFRAAGITLQPGYILWHAKQTIAGALREVRQLWELGIYNHKAALSRLIVFPGCALAESGCDTAAYEAMAPAVEAFYRRFRDATIELADAWTEAAIAEPYAAAECQLTGEGERLAPIRAALAAADARSYELFTQMAEEELR